MSGRVVCSLSLLLVCLASSARADDDGTPVFVKLGPDAPGVAVDVSFVRTQLSWNPSWPYPAWMRRVDLRVEALADAGYGGYVEFAAHDWFDSSVGDLDVGAIYRRVLGGGRSIAGRIGVVLPTGSDEIFVGADIPTTEIADPSDLVRAYPETTFLRFAIAPTLHRASILRLDVGVDVPVAGEEYEYPGVPPTRWTLGLDGVLHLDAGVAVRSGPVAVAVELQVVDALWESGSDWSASAHATFQVPMPNGTPFAGVTLPLGADVRTETPFALVLGARFPL